ncbi:MAG: SDR family NAD(P)-dependent oxidoreductase, partial [Rhodobacteraceae bacterium]
MCTGISPTPFRAMPPRQRWAGMRRTGSASWPSSDTRSEREPTKMNRRDILKFGGAAATAGIAATPASAQAEAGGDVPEMGPYARERGTANPDLPQLRDIQPIPEDYFTPNRFAGKTVIVTGCARGLGRGACIRLAREGAKVVGVDWIEDLGRETIGMLTAEGHDARFVFGDVGSAETCDRMVQVAVEAFGSVDA